MYTLPPEIWEKIIGEYGLLNRKYIDTIKMIPSRHNIMEPLYKLLQQYINYLCNLCYSIKSRKVKYTNNIITSQAIINTPYIFNKQNLVDIICYLINDITTDIITINIIKKMRVTVIEVVLNDKKVEISCQFNIIVLINCIA